jgi:hypothetical protein
MAAADVLDEGMPGDDGPCAGVVAFGPNRVPDALRRLSQIGVNRWAQWTVT